MRFQIKCEIDHAPPPWDRFIKMNEPVIDVYRGLMLERNQWMAGTPVQFSIRGRNLPDTIEVDGTPYPLEIIELEGGGREGRYIMPLRGDKVTVLSLPGSNKLYRVRSVAPDIRFNENARERWSKHHWVLHTNRIPVSEVSDGHSDSAIGSMFGPRIEFYKRHQDSPVPSAVVTRSKNFDSESKIALSFFLNDEGIISNPLCYTGTHPLIRAMQGASPKYNFQNISEDSYHVE